jgi:hypothetical protein
LNLERWTGQPQPTAASIALSLSDDNPSDWHAPSNGAGEMAMGQGSTFEWDALVPYLVHPLKVAIVEAVSWIDMPLSASELAKIFMSEFELSLVSYHLTKLAAVGAVVKVGQRPVRGALQTFYFFPGREWAGGTQTFEPV